MLRWCGVMASTLARMTRWLRFMCDGPLPCDAPVTCGNGWSETIKKLPGHDLACENLGVCDPPSQDATITGCGKCDRCVPFAIVVADTGFMTLYPSKFRIGWSRHFALQRKHHGDWMTTRHGAIVAAGLGRLCASTRISAVSVMATISSLPGAM